MEVYLYDEYIRYLEDSTPNPNNYSNHVIRTAKQYEVHHERLWKKNGEKLTQVVTKDAVEGIIKLVHSSPLGEHFATDKTFDKIRADYYWPGMRENIKTFDNKLIKHLLEKKCGIKHIIITPHHPQGNGQVERFIRILKEAIAKQVDDRVNCWNDALPAALMACRTTPSSTTGYTPYYLMHSREATMPVHVKMPLIGRIDLSDLDARIGQLVKLGTDWVVAEQNTRKKQKQQKGQHNKAVKETRYEIGEKVWVELTARRGQFDKKLHTKWDGPFYIATVFDNGTYQEGMKPNSEPKRKPIHGN